MQDRLDDAGFLQPGDARQRHHAVFADPQRQRQDRGGIGAQRVRHTDYDGVAGGAVRDEADLGPRQRVADRVVDRLRAQVQADQRGTVEFDDDTLGPPRRLELDALGAGQLF
ncbi:hypothetical protein SB4_18765, partial [Sphingomonas sanguinis]